MLSFPIVGIGTSAGGLEVLKEFFTAMPAESGMAFVVIQHLDPSHVSHMSELLAKFTDMRVVQAEDQMALDANSVYTIPPNKFLGLVEGTLHLTEPVKRDGVRMPIDFFFRSLAEDQREKAICVLLSGSGSDGTLGLREIRGAGGMIMAQEPETAQFDSMSRSAIATGLVDYVLPVAEMPGALIKYVQQSYVRAGNKAETEERTDGLNAIVRLLAEKAQSDFRPYKKTTLLRRIERRMGLKHMDNVSDYLAFLRQDPDEVARLAKDMLINVSSFFRDADAFVELREKVIAPLIAEKNDNPSLRVWVPGSATGEEAYSIAMLLLEEVGAARKNCPIQLFASDTAPEAVRFAREGLYPESIAADVSEERLKRFFVKTDKSYQVTKQLREVVIFSVQNLITEPPFSRLDLVSCRNVLIYLEADIQKKIITLFSFALRPGGYLFLGKSDGIAGQRELFDAVSSKWRIYRSQGPGRRAVENFLRWPEKKTAPGGADLIKTPPPALNLTDLNLQVLAKHFDVAIVLTDERGNILYFCGPTRKYLDHPTGQATLNLLNMIDSEFSARLRLMLRSVAQENKSGTLERVPFKREGSVSLAKVTVLSAPARKPSERLFAVIFEEVRGSQGTYPGPDSADASPKDHSLIEQLEAELKALKDDFHSSIDEYEISAEELKASNEEVMSINEELQSTNEELETSKEEIQAVNEELNTVNNELNLRMTELKETNDDLANLLNASDIGMIFLNSTFCIKRFTPSAQKLLNLMPGDLGRPISHLSHRFSGLDLVADAEKVLQNLSVIEKEVQSTAGQWYGMHCLPYRTLDNKIDGVIFTFTDVTRLKRSEEALLEARNYAENIIHTTATPLIVLNPELEIVSANKAFYETFQVTPQETEKRLLYNVGNRQWDIPRLRQLLESILPTNTKIDHFEVEYDFPRIGRRVMSLNASKVSSERKGEIQLILLSIDDITDHKQVEAQGRQLSRELEKGMSDRAVLLDEARQALVKESEERKALEEHLHHAQRMESMGVLAGGIAHDFNNLLNIIQGYASILSRAKDAETIKSAKAIVETTQRGAGFVRQLLALARKTNFKFEVIQVNDLIQELSRLLKETFPKNIEVSLDLAREVPEIRADPNQITQVLLNICLNARDAMPNGGQLALKSETVDGQNLQDHIEATAERFVCIEITDTGIGMDETVRNRIFDPFFTTKELGRGTGLGLAVAYGIMKSHSGWIRVESRPAQGTTFWLYLPVVSNQ